MLFPTLLLAFWLQGDAHPAGVKQYQERQYQAAVASLEAAAQTEKPGSPQFQESALLLGQSYYLLARMPDAIRWLQKAKQSTEVSYMLGNAHLQAHQPKEAVKAFAALFGVLPESAGAHLLTAQMMIRQELEEFAQAELKQALALDPHLPGAHLLLGELETYHGNIDEAVRELQQELSVNPNSSTAFYKLGDAYTRREDWAQAVPHLQRSIWLNPTYSGPYILLGKAYFKTGRLPDAERLLRQALRMDPQNVSAHYLLGQTLVASGKADEGKQLMQRSQELRKLNP